ncbi:MAG: LCP family protein [Treponema sp.]|nr:LCP family protein [Treponema sp.]
MKEVKFDASRLLLAAIFLLTIMGVALAVYTLRSNPVEEALSGNRVINVLFVIEENKKPLSTYVLMYYPATKRAAIFDIPGNLGLLLTRLNRVSRIDSLYDPGKTGSYETEIGKLLGIAPDFSVVITIDNLRYLVDLLEGVEVFIPTPVSFRDDSQLVLFPSGMTVLDGDKACVYATYSIPDEDRETEEFRRQRFFLGFLNRQIKMNDELKKPVIGKLYHSFFKTDMSQRTLMRLYDELSYIDTDRTNVQSVGGNLREVSGEMLIIPHWDGNLVKEVVKQTLGSLTRQSEDSLSERTHTVEVLNGTAVSGLAGRTAEMLRSFGYDVISTGNADRNDYERTVIIHRSGEENMVQAFADIIRCNNVRREYLPEELHEEHSIQNVEYKSDITLIIGRNFNGRYVVGN